MPETENEKPTPIKESRLRKGLLSDFVRTCLEYSLVILIAMGVSYWVTLRAQNRVYTDATLMRYESEIADTFKRRPLGESWPLDEMVINSADEENPRIIRTKLVVSFDKKNKKLNEQINARRSEIHSEVRNIIGARRYFEVNTVEKQKLLTQEIKTALQLIVGEPGIIDVFIIDFAVM